jgi:hypothetical protein
VKHVLGMAKRHLDLKGAKGPKLELNFLRLVYAVKELRRTGAGAQGYLLVVDEKIKRRVDKRWRKKYRAGDTVQVCVARLTDTERAMLEREVEENTDGMIAGTLGEDVGDRSSAAHGASLIEGVLKRVIESQEPGVQQCDDPAESPFDIQWNYYGRSSGGEMLPQGC